MRWAAVEYGLVFGPKMVLSAATKGHELEQRKASMMKDVAETTFPFPMFFFSLGLSSNCTQNYAESMISSYLVCCH